MAPKLIRYHLPAVGPITARLHEESRQLFAFLEGVGEIHRLRRLDHLGAVRLAYDGAHHSRWEYVATQLALIERASAIPRTQLKSEVRQNGLPVASSADELLKSWALLLSVGHLHWTFAAERIVLQELWRNRLARQRFIRMIPDQFRENAGRMFRDGDYYTIYQSIAVARMTRLAGIYPECPPWEGLMAAYLLSPATEQLERARRVFRRLRRVAYLGLDTQYAPTAVTLDLGRVLTDERTLERHALADSDSEESELVALDAHMARSVYLARNTLTAAASRERRLRSTIRKAMIRPAHLPDLLEQLAIGEHQKDLPAEDLVSVVRVLVRAATPLDIFMSEQTNARREEEAFRRDLRERSADCLPVVWTVPGRGEWVVQLHAVRHATLDAAQGICTVMSRIREYRRQLLTQLSFLDESDLQESLFSPIARDLIIASLTLAFGDRLRWELGISTGPQAVFSTRRNAREFVSTEVKALASRPDAGPRRAELELLYDMLLGSPDAHVIASIASVRGFVREERVPIVEVDCVLVTEQGKRLEIHLGEAKTGHGSVNAAATQLRLALKRLSIDEAATVQGPRLITRRLRKSQSPVRSRAVARIAL